MNQAKLHVQAIRESLRNADVSTPTLIQLCISHVMHMYMLIQTGIHVQVTRKTKIQSGSRQ